VERDLILEVEQWVEEHYDATCQRALLPAAVGGTMGGPSGSSPPRHAQSSANLLVGFDESGLGKGSGGASRRFAGGRAAAMVPLISKFGGHEMAAA
jgi:hypothetical protein